MAYVMTKVKVEDQEKILSDASSDKRRRLAIRGGFFNYVDDLHWAVDHDREQYLVRAPSLVPRTLDTYYFMFFRGRMYSLVLKGASGPDLVIEDAVDPEELNDLQAAITEAFAVHKYHGHVVVPRFVGAQGEQRGA